MKEFKSIGQAVSHVLDNMPVGTVFHGNELHEMVAMVYPKARDAYVDTVMRKARQYRREYFKCISYSESVYERVKPWKE